MAWHPNLINTLSLSDWLGIIGVVSGVAIFLIDKLFSDQWHRFPFRWGKYSVRLTGNATRIHMLKGRTAAFGSGTSCQIRPQFTHLNK